MDVSHVIRRRLDKLGLEQKDLAQAAGVTESYVSQLLTRRKAPPVPGRTDIYEKMERFLDLGAGDLSRLADLERREELKRLLGEETAPLFGELRALILRTCARARVRSVRAIFERQPFGELERLVTQKLLDVAKWVVREEQGNTDWLHMVAQFSGQTEEGVHAAVQGFLDTDIFRISAEHRTWFLEPLLQSWDIDLATFDLTIVLNHPVAAGHVKQFGFIEKEPEEAEVEEGLREFLAAPGLSGNTTEEELEFLKKLKFNAKRPTALYYYRELQNLRDPLHFKAVQSE